jgi:hypothetical protein
MRGGTVNRVIERLKAARDLAWASLVPAYDLAIIQAEQAEYEAERACTLAQYGFPAVYPPLVLKLAESVTLPEPKDYWAATP